MTVLLVAVGGMAGVLTRYGLNLLFASIWTVATINLAGCFALGVLTAVAVGWSPPVRDGIGIGFLGGFTTFSSFAVQAVIEVDGGRSGTAALYVAVSVVGGVVAAAVGYALGRGLA